MRVLERAYNHKRELRRPLAPLNLTLALEHYDHQPDLAHLDIDDECYGHDDIDMFDSVTQTYYDALGDDLVHDTSIDHTCTHRHDVNFLPENYILILSFAMLYALVFSRLESGSALVCDDGCEKDDDGKSVELH